MAFMVLSQPGNHAKAITMNTMNCVAATSSREAGNFPSSRALCSRRGEGFSVLLCESPAMTVESQTPLRPLSTQEQLPDQPHDGSRSLREHLWENQDQPRQQSERYQHLDGKCQSDQLELRIEPPEQGERNIHDQEQREQRQ